MNWVLLKPLMEGCGCVTHLKEKVNQLPIRIGIAIY